MKLLITVLSLVAGQLPNNPPILAKLAGHKEGKNMRNIQIEVFYDPFCVDSAESDFLLSAALDKNLEDKKFGTRKVRDLVQVHYHMFSLPYLHASWIPAKAFQYVSLQCEEKPYECKF